MPDLFKNVQPGLESPASRLAAVTPDDGQDVPFASRALVAGTAGTVQVTTVAGDTGQIYLAAGVPFPIRVQRVWSTGTTATGLTVLA